MNGTSIPMGGFAPDYLMKLQQQQTPNWMNQLVAAQEAANKANEQRYQQAMAIYDEIISRYQPGGTFGKAALGQLEKQKARDIGKETQQMISSGLFGTTTTAGLPRRWEEEVGAPARLKLEDIMMQRLSQAQIGKAGFIERREDVGPGFGTLAQMGQQAGATQPHTFTRTINRGGGVPSMQEFGANITATPGAGGTGQRITRESAGLPPRTGAVLAGGGTTTTPTPSISSGKAPTIPEYLQSHGVDPNATDAASISKARRLQQQWAKLYMKRR